MTNFNPSSSAGQLSDLGVLGMVTLMAELRGAIRPFEGILKVTSSEDGQPYMLATGAINGTPESLGLDSGGWVVSETPMGPNSLLDLAKRDPNRLEGIMIMAFQSVYRLARLVAQEDAAAGILEDWIWIQATQLGIRLDGSGVYQIKVPAVSAQTDELATARQIASQLGLPLKKVIGIIGKVKVLIAEPAMWSGTTRTTAMYRRVEAIAYVRKQLNMSEST